MAHDLNVNMKNLENILGKLPDNFKDVLSGLMKNDVNETPALHNNSGASNLINSFLGNIDNSNKNDMGINMETIMNITGLINSMQNTKDDKIDLILALTPFLKPSRQDKAHSLVKVLRYATFFNAASSLNLVNGSKESKED